MEPYRNEILTNEVHLYRIYKGESQLVNIFTNLLHEALPSIDFILLNAGSFRSEWFPGPITEADFESMFPFENNICSFEISGSSLISMLKTLQSGRRGLYHLWNINQTVQLLPEPKLTSASFFSSAKIQPEKIYKGATIEFLLKGGDDFEDVMKENYAPVKSKVEGKFK